MMAKYSLKDQVGETDCLMQATLISNGVYAVSFNFNYFGHCWSDGEPRAVIFNGETVIMAMVEFGSAPIIAFGEYGIYTLVPEPNVF